MEYVSYFPSLTAARPEPVAWETAMTAMRGETLREKTEMYRALLLQHDLAVASSNTVTANAIKERMGEIKRSCPAIVCQASLEGGKDRTCIRGYTGFMMVDFDHVQPELMSVAFGVVAADPHTFMAYTTISGRGLRVIARVEGEVTEENYRAAWLSVNEYYKRITELDYDTQCSNATRLCGLAYDRKRSF